MATVQQIVDKLNEVLAHDPEWMHEIFNHRVVCNQAMADHPTCQVGEADGFPDLRDVSPLGEADGFPDLRDVSPLGVIEALIGSGSRIVRIDDDSVEGNWINRFSTWDEDQVSRDLTKYPRDPQYLGDGTICAERVASMLNELIAIDRQAIHDLVTHYPRCKPDLEATTGVKTFEVQVDNATHAGIMGLVNAFIAPEMVMRNTGDDGLAVSFNVVDDEQRNIYLRESGQYFPTDIKVEVTNDADELPQDIIEIDEVS